MRKIALLTCDNLTDFVTDEHFLEEALRGRSWDYDWISWRQTDVDWSVYDCAIIRTTWDYIQHKDLFLQNLLRIEKAGCLLLNSWDLVRWNSDKRYLSELEKKGVSIVPTVWTRLEDVNQIDDYFDALKAEKIVIKPNVGAGAADTFLLEQKKWREKQRVLQTLLEREVMIQPFMKNIVTEGEFSAHFFRDKFSHMVLKKPKDSDFRSQEEFGSLIKRVEVEPKQMAFCKKVLAQVDLPYLYARVDFIRGAEEDYKLIELEMVEPSLYFRYQNGSADKFVLELEALLEIKHKK